MKNKILSLFAILWATTCYAQDLPYCLPEDQEISQAAVSAFFDSLMSQPQTRIHAAMVLKNGYVVGEIHPQPFKPEYGHALYSCSKTFTAIAVAMACEDGLLQYDSPVLPLLEKAFPHSVPATVSDTLRRLTVTHLLEMSSGWKADWGLRSRSENWLPEYLNRHFDFEPGSQFEYDSMVSYILSAVVQAATGRQLYDYLQDRLFGPLGIEAAWEQSPEGISCGGWGLYMNAASMAKVGQMLLQNGVYDNRRYLSEASVRKLATCRRTDTWGDCYGMHTWIFSEHPDAYRADGAYGQFVIVLPSQNMVVVLTQCSTGDLDREMELVWKVLLSQAISQKPVKSLAAWKKQLAKYTLPTVVGNSNGVNHLCHRQWTLSDNLLGWKNLKLEHRSNIVRLIVTDMKGVTGTIDMSYNRWKTSSSQLKPLNARPFKGSFSNIPGPFVTAGSYAWQNENLCARVYFTNWFTAVDIVFRPMPHGMTMYLLPCYESEWIEVTAK